MKAGLNMEDKNVEAKSLQVKQLGLPKTVQSANTIFHFMEKSEFLKSKLQECALIPRYNEEKLGYLKIDLPQIVYPMICFCDIRLNKIEQHTINYGSYAIAFSKEWGLNHNIQPIHYINTNSAIIDDFRQAYNSALNIDINNIYVNNLENYLFSHLLYMKPLNEYFTGTSEKNTHSFQDECEWRYVPKLDNAQTELQLIYTNISDKTTRDKFSEALSSVKECYLLFKYSDIKYLIVPSENEKNEFIEYILSDKILASEKDKLQLISKILVLTNLKEDA